MRAILRRLARIEERLSPAANTKHLHWLRERLYAAWQRMAKCGYTFADAASKREETRGWTLVERLQCGRQMAFEAG